LFPPQLLSQIRGVTPWCTSIAFGSAWLAGWQLVQRTEARALFLGQPAFRVLLALAVGIPLLQALFQLSTFNGAENVVFFSILSLGTAVGVLWRLLPASAHRSVAWLFGITAGLLFLETAHAARQRLVHDVFPNHKHVSRRMTSAPLANVHWIDPTVIHGTVMQPEDIEATLAYLGGRPERFLLLGECTYLYGMSGRTPPTPLLYFITDQYYTAQDIPKLDAWMLAQAKQDDVRLVVRERQTFMFENDFPETKRWVDESFRLTTSFGNFEILERRGRGGLGHGLSSPCCGAVGRRAARVLAACAPFGQGRSDDRGAVRMTRAAPADRLSQCGPPLSRGSRSGRTSPGPRRRAGRCQACAGVRRHRACRWTVRWW
jgi:hypothetical protein